MKKMKPFVYALLMAVVPGIASAVLVEALDFTGAAASWTVNVIDPGYAHTLELDADPTKVGYAQNTSTTGAVNLFQQVSAPAGFTMSSITLQANVSGYSSWVMLGRVGLGLTETNSVPILPHWGGIDTIVPGGTVYLDEPVVVDASANPSFTGLTSVWVGVEIHKGLTNVYQRADVSSVEVHAVLTSTNSVQNPVAFSTGSVGDVVEISFDGFPSQLYELQYTEDLISPAWIDVGVVVRGTSGDSVAYDAATGLTQKNYRLVQASP
jgi:hypothetical protein